MSQVHAKKRTKPKEGQLLIDFDNKKKSTSSNEAALVENARPRMY